MKLVLSVLLVLAVVAPTIVKADTVSQDQAKAEFVQRKLSEIEAQTIELKKLQDRFESATVQKNGSIVVTMAGLIGSPVALGIGVVVYGQGTERECLESKSCRMAIVGVMVADAAMILGGGLSITVSSIEREHIRENILRKQAELAAMEGSLKSMLTSSQSLN